ncbi:MAG TPA: redoxin domain-containing protein, partial [Kofleriaceae bacterium]|nr:redoxin domain-containing protein [Kofleriaceae bacterium]
MLARITLAAMVVTASACGSSSTPASAPAAADVVSFTLPNDRGDLIDVPLASGRAVVIDAWGPTCAPCREKVPALVAKAAELEAAGATLVLVAVLADGEDTEAARQTLASWGVTRDFLI